MLPTAFATDARRSTAGPVSAAGICALLCLFAATVCAQAPAAAAAPASSAQDAALIENEGFAVEVDGRPILFVYVPVGAISAQERAENISERIVNVAKQLVIPVDSIGAQDRESWTEIAAGSEMIMGITEGDARAAGKPRTQLAAESAQLIRTAVQQYREEHTWRHFIVSSIETAAATLVFAVLLVLLFVVRRRTVPALEAWMDRREAETAEPHRVRFRWLLGRPLFAVMRLLFWILLLLMLQAYVTVVLRFFPSTRYTSHQITNWLFSQLAGFGRLMVGYIPNLVLALFIFLVTFYLLKVNNYIFRELREERITIHGFYSDWAEPTAKLVRVLILAAAAVVVFPYLPGSDSPAFKGISVFLGILLSLGSTSTMAHGVAGTILTYMRAFQVGDFVRIGNDVGEVVEKTLLVTRICTPKREVITIPNGTVLGGVVINYSAEARHAGVIFHTTVTIGYAAPWRRVHEVLIEAALATEDVLQDPAPFVLQTALNDFYASYELNAYTTKPTRMQNIYSLLHQNIQDKFNEAGIEINSPHYTSLRDGEQPAVPDEYLPKMRKASEDDSAHVIAHARSL